MMGIIRYEVSVHTEMVGSKCTAIIEIDEEDLEGVEGDVDDYVWEELGGKDTAFDMVYMDIKRLD